MQASEIRRRTLLQALGAGAIGMPLGGLAQARYPVKPVTIIVSQPAGGDADALQ